MSSTFAPTNIAEDGKMIACHKSLVQTYAPRPRRHILITSSFVREIEEAVTTMATGNRVRAQEHVPLSDVETARVDLERSDDPLSTVRTLETYIRSEFPPPSTTPPRFPPNLFDGISPTPSPQLYEAMPPMEEIPSIRSERSVARCPLPSALSNQTAPGSNFVSYTRPPGINADNVPAIWKERMMANWETSPSFLPLPLRGSPASAFRVGDRRRVSDPEQLSGAAHEESRVLSYREPPLTASRPTLPPLSSILGQFLGDRATHARDRNSISTWTSEMSQHFPSVFATPGSNFLPLPSDFSGSVGHSDAELPPMVVPGEVVDTWSQVLAEDVDMDGVDDEEVAYSRPHSPDSLACSRCQMPVGDGRAYSGCVQWDFGVTLFEDDKENVAPSSYRNESSAPAALIRPAQRGILSTLLFSGVQPIESSADADFAGPRYADCPHALPAEFMQLVMDQIDPPSPRRRRESIIGDDSDDEFSSRLRSSGSYRRDPEATPRSPEDTMAAMAERDYLDSLDRIERGVPQPAKSPSPCKRMNSIPTIPGIYSAGKRVMGRMSRIFRK